MERDLASWLAKAWPDVCWAEYAATSYSVPQRKAKERGSQARERTLVDAIDIEVRRLHPQARQRRAESCSE